jgi:hypothetical protein
MVCSTLFRDAMSANQISNRFTETKLSSKYYEFATTKETAIRMYMDVHDLNQDMHEDLIVKVREASTLEGFLSALYQVAELGTQCIIEKEARVE